MSLVRPLFEGPIDVVGDTHGEIQALHDLLARLGYREDGTHPQGRRLVFVGDLTDRGPDSPAVVALVQRFVENGLAQCVLGNHDLNLLLGDEKYDNNWFYGREFLFEGAVVPQKMLHDDKAAGRSRSSSPASPWPWSGPACVSFTPAGTRNRSNLPGKPPTWLNSIATMPARSRRASLARIWTKLTGTWSFRTATP